MLQVVLGVWEALDPREEERLAFWQIAVVKRERCDTVSIILDPTLWYPTFQRQDGSQRGHRKA